MSYNITICEKMFVSHGHNDVTNVFKITLFFLPNYSKYRNA